MALVLDTAPTEQPITRTEAKDQARVGIRDDDLIFDRLIEGATNYCEVFTKRKFITQTWDLVLDDFPSEFLVPFPTLQSVTSIVYLDFNEVSTTLAASEYDVDIITEPGRIVESLNKTWPTTAQVINAVTVKFIAGYGAASAVPQGIKSAIAMLVAHWYEHREAATELQNINKFPLGFDDLLMTFVIDVETSYNRVGN